MIFFEGIHFTHHFINIAVNKNKEKRSYLIIQVIFINFTSLTSNNFFVLLHRTFLTIGIERPYNSTLVYKKSRKSIKAFRIYDLFNFKIYKKLYISLLSAFVSVPTSNLLNVRI